MNFTPDYKNILDAAYNREAARMPLYEHIICDEIMEQVLGRQFSALHYGDRSEKKEYFKRYVEFFRQMGYDTVSFECTIGSAMPGSGSLGGHKPGEINSREDFDRYPWDSVERLYFDKYAPEFELLREVMPAGMKAIGGAGNGVFECVQDVVGFMDLCYVKADDPELYADLFSAAGDVICRVWARFLKEFGDVYCVCRFGDDLGFKSGTLLTPDDIKSLVLPQYQKVVALVHSYNKPFLLHSCGCIFDVMDDIIEKVKINAKHSNEDQIADFSLWVEKYGDKIGNFGGIDTDDLCSKSEAEIKEITADRCRFAKGHGGYALGSGNSIPNYVPIEGYLAMVNTAREIRGDYRS